MDLGSSTITMDHTTALAAYRDYAEALERRHNDEDAAIAKGYKALAEGKRLISLADVIRRGGVDEIGRPRLAVAPAQADWVWMDRSRDGRVSFAPTARPRRENTAGRVNLPAGTLPQIVGEWYGPDGLYWKLCGWRNRAMVPVVPPRLRPTRALTGYHILFEAEWERVVPVDPALIRRLAGDLWILVAEWNLTPLERAVLAERLN